MDNDPNTARSGSKGTVLVVDDDTALAEMLTIVLNNEGFETVVCGSGDKALAMFREERPDIVLLDLMLPGMDGVDVCKAIRAESGVPIVMLTAKNDTVDIVVGLESGADDYIVKPFKPKELVARIRARLHLDALGVELTELSKDQAAYLGIHVDGPYKPDHYRY